MHSSHRLRSLARRMPSASFFVLALLSALALFTVAAADLASAADYYVSDLPGAPDGPLLKMHAGHIEVDEEHHGGLFFWHFQNRHIGDRQRTVVWLNGGPGCSSMDGALMEIGPYRVREGGKLVYNNGSWDEFANLLFVDSPVGTGFSYVDTNAYLHELSEVADQFVVFLEKWFSIFPEYYSDDLYFAGESYAGQYIPYIAQAIVDRNKRVSNQGVKPWNLKGLLIGNGWISGAEQYPAYNKFVFDRGIVKQDSLLGRKLESTLARCKKTLANGGSHHVDSKDCENILTQILTGTRDSKAAPNEQCLNMYDVRLRDSWAACGMNWPPDLGDVTSWLRDEKVTAALHVDPSKKVTGWKECSAQVGQYLSARNSKPSVELLPGLLKEMPIILFSGGDDLICNHIGTEALINNLEWNGGKGFEVSPDTLAARRHWTFEGEKAGIYQEARNLTYVLFYNASHMVPFDWPRRSRFMLDRFMGVDIDSIGGDPADSRIDGKKGKETSVGGHPTSDAAQEKEQEKVDQAKRDAYYRSGEVALVVVGVAAAAWFWYVWRDRRKRRKEGYRGVSGGSAAGPRFAAGRADAANGASPLESFRDKGKDLDAADSDDVELETGRFGAHGDAEEQRRYSLGSASSEESSGRATEAKNR